MRSSHTALGAAALLLAVSGVSGHAVGGPPSTTGAAGAHWTADRLRSARPVVERSADRGRPPGSPGTPFEGLPMVGTFFWEDGTGTGRFCGGTVVRSPGRNLVMSAGHCFDHRDARENLVFVPRYDDGRKPYGVFTVTAGGVHVDQRYLTRGRNAAADLDFAFLRVGPNGGKDVEDAVGGAELLIDAGYAHDPVRLIGYPADQRRPLDCTDRTVRHDSTDPEIPGSFLRIACDDYSGGTSGGPFLVGRGTGWGVIGVIGGWRTGGDTADISYASYLDADAKALYDAAAARAGTPG